MKHSEDLSVKGLNISGEKAFFLVSVETQVLRKKQKSKKRDERTCNQDCLCQILDEEQDPVSIAVGNLLIASR